VSRGKGIPLHGWLNIDKPLGVTSTQVVAAVKRLTGAQKVGHGGTLDPLASGILPIALGEATKTVSYVMDGRKTYGFTVRWGQTTDTDDAEGQITATCDLRPNRDAILAALPAFIGEITQVPPRYSAIKVDGARAYDLARDGATVELNARTVRVDGLTLRDQPDADHARFLLECGKGTYVRSLARDLGVALGCLGYVVALRRLQVARFSEATSISLDDLAGFKDSAGPNVAPAEWLGPCLLPVKTALDDIPALAVTEPEAHRLRQGQSLPLLRRADLDRVSGMDRLGDDGIVLALAGDEPVALLALDGGQLHPVRVFNL
jgi:tRNA pseudouridine55 synthase